MNLTDLIELMLYAIVVCAVASVGGTIWWLAGRKDRETEKQLELAIKQMVQEMRKEVGK